jgi:hypothetical protein
MYYPFFLDDLDVSPDFLDYFQALYPLLVRDKTLYCISAWNDNGIAGKIDRQASEKRRSIISNKDCFFKLFYIVVISFLALGGY